MSNEKETITAEFAFKVTAIVKPLPFYEKGKLIVPKPEERYKVVARAWTEGQDPYSKKVAARVIYHLKPLHTLALKKDAVDYSDVKVVPETDEVGRPYLALYSEPKITKKDVDNGDYLPANNDKPVTIHKP